MQGAKVWGRSQSCCPYTLKCSVTWKVIKSYPGDFIDLRARDRAQWQSTCYCPLGVSPRETKEVDGEGGERKLSGGKHNASLY